MSSETYPKILFCHQIITYLVVFCVHRYLLHDVFVDYQPLRNMRKVYFFAIQKYFIAVLYSFLWYFFVTKVLEQASNIHYL